jgi:hypothetical protein
MGQEQAQKLRRGAHRRVRDVGDSKLLSSRHAFSMNCDTVVLPVPISPLEKKDALPFLDGVLDLGDRELVLTRPVGELWVGRGGEGFGIEPEVLQVTGHASCLLLLEVKPVT